MFSIIPTGAFVEISVLARERGDSLRNKEEEEEEGEMESPVKEVKDEYCWRVERDLAVVRLMLERCCTFVSRALNDEVEKVF